MTQSLPSLSTLLVREANLKPGTALLLETAIRELVRDEICSVLDEQESAKQRDDELVARIVQGIRQEMGRIGAGAVPVSQLLEPMLNSAVSEIGLKLIDLRGEVNTEIRETRGEILKEVRART